MSECSSWYAGLESVLAQLQVFLKFCFKMSCITDLQWTYCVAGMSLLKVGGRMVYSTCSMNPVENEAVVAEVIYQLLGSILPYLDFTHELYYYYYYYF